MINLKASPTLLAHDLYDDNGEQDRAAILWNDHHELVVERAGGADYLMQVFMQGSPELVTSKLQIACGELVRGEV